MITQSQDLRSNIMKKVGVIYQIKCLVNNRIYIGQTTYYKERICKHKGDLRKNKHHNKALQFDYDKFGLEKFEFSIVEDNIPYEKLLEVETNYMNKFGGIDSDNLYNEEDRYHMTAYVKQKISENRKGLLCGSENGMYGTNMKGEANPMYGKKHSKETKKIIGEKSKIGRKYFKYTLEFVEELRLKKSNGYKLKDLSKEYNIAESTLSTLINYGPSKNSLNKV
jgi:group I intron endonuclease